MHNTAHNARTPLPLASSLALFHTHTHTDTSGGVQSLLITARDACLVLPLSRSLVISLTHAHTHTHQAACSHSTALHAIIAQTILAAHRHALPSGAVLEGGGGGGGRGGR